MDWSNQRSIIIDDFILWEIGFLFWIPKSTKLWNKHIENFHTISILIKILIFEKFFVA